MREGGEHQDVDFRPRGPLITFGTLMVYL